MGFSKGAKSHPRRLGGGVVGQPSNSRPLVSRALMDEVAAAGLGSRSHAGQPLPETHTGSPSLPFGICSRPTSGASWG